MNFNVFIAFTTAVTVAVRFKNVFVDRWITSRESLEDLNTFRDTYNMALTSNRSNLQTNMKSVKKTLKRN